ncbi:MAG TPA: hypothetical protein DIU14_05800 [Actinobacteria bacterium]|nr:hypothetical protein [Actinomycetota bacterium]
MRGPSRPLHAATAVGATLHHGFELAAGVGLVFQPYLGLAGASAMWGTLFPAWLVVSMRGSRRWDPLLAFAAGMSLGAAVLHFSLWPWSVRRGLPWLREAEGLRPEHLRAYNSVLYGWASVAAAALAFETPRRSRGWAVAGFAATVPLRRTARYHFRWLREEARTHPAWWNRALVEAARRPHHRT